MSSLAIPVAVAAGVVSFASPCFLPIVPAYVGYVAGSSDGPRRPWSSCAHAVSFVAGFTTVFVALWASLGLVGAVAGDLRGPLRVAGGVVLVVMGLHVAGLIELSVLWRSVRMPWGAAATDVAPQQACPATFTRSALLGVAFGAGWTPCIGPILGGVLGLASTSATVAEGAVLLVAYSLGLGIPFVLVAMGFSAVRHRLAWFTRHHWLVGLVSGGFLVLMGFLMITGSFARLSGLAPWLGL